MSKDLAVVVIHGMGSQAGDFAQGLSDEIDQRVADLGKDPGRIAWRPIYWANILEGRQSRYLANARKTAELDFVRLRRFVVAALGDASAYQRVESAHNTTYETIHDRVSAAITHLYINDLGSKPKPMIVIAHSLGGHIMSNHIWDMHKLESSTLSPFERMQYLVGFVTFGCNIPLFIFAYDEVRPIVFPPKQLPKRLKKKAKWLNFYDPDDVLGYPLRPINPAYRKVVSSDTAINVGGVLSSWNPLSHSKYWTDDDFTEPTAAFVASFL